MTEKQFKLAKVLIVIIVAAIVAENVVNKEFFIPIVVVVLASLLMLFLKTRVKAVLADERDYQIAGRAATLSIQIYGWLSMITMLILYSQQGKNPAFAVIAVTLAYTTCILLLLYAIIFRLYQPIVSRFKKYEK